MNKTLVAYFSAGGATKRLANTLAEAVGADLYEIKPATPYTGADLNWNNSSSRSSIEMNDPASRPAMADPAADVEQYDTVFLGFPIWWYEAPRIVQSFLESCELSGKTVVPFATSGGSDIGNTANILQKSCQTAKVLHGKRFGASASASELSAWVKSLGL